MLTKESTIAMIGAGAIGGITAAFIEQAGWDLELVCKHKNLAEIITKQGVHISGINSLGVIGGVRLGELLADQKVRLIFIELMREAMAVAAALNIQVAPAGAGKLDYYKLLGRRSWLANLNRHLTIRIIGFKYRRIKSSSLQSIERGRRTEIDFLNGYICDRGLENGVPTPINEAVRNMVREIEDGKRKMSLKNVEDSAFDI